MAAFDEPRSGSAAAGPDHTPEGEGAPHVVDKRKIDPTTFEVRSQAAGAAASSGGTAGAAGSSSDPVSSDPASSGTTAADGTTGDALVTAEALAAERLDQLQHAQADLYNLDQRYSAYVKRTRGELASAADRGAAALAEALIPVLDDIELARRHGELTGPFQSVAERLEATLERFGVERYGAAGEEFDPTVHEALMHGHSPDVETTTVQQVLQPGYRTVDRVLRAARVAVVDPEPQV
ncbi:MAG: nucleotide exchange factor GrpE [Micrococcales bacterium]|nr:nucleotide exchange factor GrpE [Micrococcales bacterium]